MEDNTNGDSHVTLHHLILKARHLSGSAFCIFNNTIIIIIMIGVPEQALAWIPLGVGIDCGR